MITTTMSGDGRWPARAKRNLRRNVPRLEPNKARTHSYLRAMPGDTMFKDKTNVRTRDWRRVQSNNPPLTVLCRTGGDIWFSRSQETISHRISHYIPLFSLSSPCQDVSLVSVLMSDVTTCSDQARSPGAHLCLATPSSDIWPCLPVLECGASAGTRQAENIQSSYVERYEDAS